jgi:Insertion element 4 transposase N-terminal/Transposase DDE domain
MARTRAMLGAGARLSDYLSTGLLARTCPREVVEEVLRSCGRRSQRQRDLPAHAMVYYVMALPLYMGVAYEDVLRCVTQGMGFLGDAALGRRAVGKSGISQARTRLGSEVMERLARRQIRPIAKRQTAGAWYRRWRLVTLDGSTLEVADEAANAKAFGYPGSQRGRIGYPQVRFVGLLESATRVLFGVRMGGCRASEMALARQAIEALKRGMLCLADRRLSSYELWRAAAATGAQLLWRGKKNLVLPIKRSFPDGSYLSTIHPGAKARRVRAPGIVVRVIDYRLPASTESEPRYRLLTTLLDPKSAPATELAALYHERWEIEDTLEEFKTQLTGAQVVLRSKTPELVKQEFYGLWLAHFAIRTLIHEAALDQGGEPMRVKMNARTRVIVK